MASIFRTDQLTVPDDSQSITTKTLFAQFNAPTNDWAAKGGPSSWNQAYKFIWTLSAGSNKSIIHNASNNSFRITQDGYYEVNLHQRVTGAGDNYVGIALNGDRRALEYRPEGIWTHSHATYAYEYTDSYYIGILYKDELITGGAPTSSNLFLGATGAYGFMNIIRLG